MEKSNNIITFTTAMVLLYLLFSILSPFVQNGSATIIANDFGNSQTETSLTRFLQQRATGEDDEIISAKNINDITIINENEDATKGQNLLLSSKASNSADFLDTILPFWTSLKLIAQIVGLAASGGFIMLAAMYMQAGTNYLLQALITLFFLPINIVFIYQSIKLVLGKGRI